MPVYVEGTPKEGYYIEVTEYDRNANNAQCKVVTRFYRRSEKLIINSLHRTDGPAVVTWDTRMKGSTKLYYINGTMVDKNKFIEVLNAPFEMLPLFVSDPLLGEIAKDRLRGARSSIELNEEHSHLKDFIEHHGKVLSSKQVLIKNLVTSLNKNLNKAIWEKVKGLKVLS